MEPVFHSGLSRRLANSSSPPPPLALHEEEDDDLDLDLDGGDHDDDLDDADGDYADNDGYSNANLKKPEANIVYHGCSNIVTSLKGYFCVLYLSSIIYEDLRKRVARMK